MPAAINPSVGILFPTSMATSRRSLTLTGTGPALIASCAYDGPALQKSLIWIKPFHRARNWKPPVRLAITEVSLIRSLYTTAEIRLEIFASHSTSARPGAQQVS
jgi:hypothetical protein